MKSYPSITTEINKTNLVRVYEKLDGSNVRAEWSKAKGFYKFGSRNQLLSPNDPILSPAISLILGMSEEFEKWFKTIARSERGICYFEFHGPGSFAGSHTPGDEMKASLLDVDLYKRGFISQDDYEYFLEKQTVFNTPKLILEGHVNNDIIEAVRSGKIGSFEGVVCKGVLKNMKQNKPLMFKIKNREWVNKVKETYKNNPEKIAKLIEPEDL